MLSVASLLDKNHLLIWGCGREGKSTYKTIRKYFPTKSITIADQNPDMIEDELFKGDKHLVFHPVERFFQWPEGVDLIIKSPGISLKEYPELKRDRRLTSQTDIFLQVFASQVIGVTGTKGKSTTSTLIYTVLKACQEDALLIGNIGVPAFDMLDRITPKTHIVFELSAHQLEFIKSSPHIAILLNFFQEHLDHYVDYEDYQLAKWNITRRQQPGDYFIFPEDQILIHDHLKKVPTAAEIYTYALENTMKIQNGIYAEGTQLFFVGQGRITKKLPIDFERRLKGDHNLMNLLAVMNVCEILHIPDDHYLSVFKEFNGLPHRLEYIGKYHDIHFYNDSISTIPEATIAALQALKRVDTLILGGFDRGIDYRPLGIYLSRGEVASLIFVGDAGKRIYQSLQEQHPIDSIHCFFASDYEEVVSLCFAHTPEGGICLLSPAAASYDSFKNFEHRGTFFKELILRS